MLEAQQEHAVFVEQTLKAQDYAVLIEQTLKAKDEDLLKHNIRTLFQ
jgi:hypothetical protein